MGREVLVRAPLFLFMLRAGGEGVQKSIER